MKDSNKTAKQLLTKLSYDLIRKQPFYGEILIKLRDAIELDKETCERMSGMATAFASGNRIYYCKEFIEELSDKEGIFTFMHELCHIIWRHVLRRDNRNPILWNIACDLVVNTYLTDNQQYFAQHGAYYGDVPDKFVTIHSLKTSFNLNHNLTASDVREMTVEKVYEHLIQNNDESKFSSMTIEVSVDADGNVKVDGDGQGDGKGDQQDQNGSGKFKVKIPRDLINDDDIKNDPEGISNEIRRIIQEASMSAKPAGDEKGTLLMEIQDLKGTDIPWYKLVRRFLTSKEPDEDSYDTPDKRYLHNLLVLPGPVEDDESRLENAIIAIDTSGSVAYDKDLMTEFFYQLKTLLKDFELDANVILWDTDVQSDTPINTKTDFDKLIKSIRGGGGTDINPVLKYIRDKYRNKYSCLIILSDGYLFNDPRFRMRDVISIIPRNGERSYLEKLGRVVEISKNAA